MALDKKPVHRSGPLKQSNKAHKHGKHRSKGALNIAAKGKVSVKTISKKNHRELKREERRNQASQIRKNKRDEVLAKKRALGGLDIAPFLVSVIPLNREFDPTTAVAILTQCDESAVVKVSPTGVTHVCVPRFKKRFSLVVPSTDNEFDVLDSLKVADTVLFMISAVNGADDIEQMVDQWGNRIMMSSFAQGLPTPIVVLTDLESVAPKKRNDFKQSVQKMVAKWLPDEKIMVLDKNVDGINILRRIGDQKKKPVYYRDKRAFLYGEEVEYIPDHEGTAGTLKVMGYLRGTALSVDQLVHIPGLGDFQMFEIDAAFDPNKIDSNRNKDTATMDVTSNSIKILAKADPSKQECLYSEFIPDPMDAEQTWPTQDDFELAEKERQIKKKNRAPEGWSDYQAAWIPEEDAEFQEDADSDSEQDSEKEDFMDADSEERSVYSDAEDTVQDFDTATESEAPVNDDKYDQEMDLNAEKEELEKMKEAKSDAMFPDEVDTPMDTPARIRFQKYRALQSFRTSPWDPKENLPSDYARIFHFQNFSRFKKRILKEEEEKDGVQPGSYITIHVKNVSQLMWSTFEKTRSPVVIVGLFPHEQKMTVVNVELRRTQNYDLPIKSKERLIFQCGFRRFVVNPLFSQNEKSRSTLKRKIVSSSEDGKAIKSTEKHKFERFFQPNVTTVATFYAPIQYPPAPVLCYKEVMGTLVLVAIGNLLSCDPDRLIIKRIVLSGHPFKIMKKSATIRFMFFNREDIMYYKSCELVTKSGRRGEIKEPLGTHGHMKCRFTKPLKSHDTVLLKLYKRVFPKWTYENLVVSCVNNDMETQ